MDRKVSVVILNYNGKDFLKVLLPSLYAQTYLPDEVILVDNASSDSSVEWVKREFPGVKVIVNPTNLFFSRGMNIGIRESRGKYILCLNNDLRLSEKFLEEMLQHMNVSPGIGMACGRIYDWEGKRLDACGQTISLWGTPRDRGRGRRKGGRFSKVTEVFSPGGIAVLYRREMLEEIKEEGGYFDEKLRIFYEDLDLAWRARKKGWKCIFVPSALAFHYRGGTTIREKRKGPMFMHLSPYLKEQIILNRYRTWKKNATLKEFLVRLPFFLAYDVFLWTVHFLSSPSQAKKTFWRALRNA
ncbi:MAG: glycosyltransferase family 2 protein [Caldiserica bacterium]|nr:glycosyltransferase family 2 protein [Caldisericota bacterium]